MNVTSASPVEPAFGAGRPAAGTHADTPTAPRRVLVWDAPVRLAHWLMVASFAGAWLTAESEGWRLLHVTLGYTLGALVLFRLVWGLVGTRHARFTAFVRGPAAAVGYLKALLRGQAPHFTGHNPAGALAIVALLALAGLVTASGWASYEELGGEWLKEAHELLAGTMLAVVGVHLLGVIVGSLQHRENLVGAMLSGRKPGRPDEAIRSAWRSVAALMLVAVLGFWWLQWRDAPAGGAPADRPAMASGERGHASQGGHGGRNGRQRGDDD